MKKTENPNRTFRRAALGNIGLLLLIIGICHLTFRKKDETQPKSKDTAKTKIGIGVFGKVQATHAPLTHFFANAGNGQVKNNASVAKKPKTKKAAGFSKKNHKTNKLKPVKSPVKQDQAMAKIESITINSIPVDKFYAMASELFVAKDKNLVTNDKHELIESIQAVTENCPEEDFCEVQTTTIAAMHEGCDDAPAAPMMVQTAQKVEAESNDSTSTPPASQVIAENVSNPAKKEEPKAETDAPMDSLYLDSLAKVNPEYRYQMYSIYESNQGLLASNSKEVSAISPADSILRKKNALRQSLARLEAKKREEKEKNTVNISNSVVNENNANNALQKYVPIPMEDLTGFKMSTDKIGKIMDDTTITFKRIIVTDTSKYKVIDLIVAKGQITFSTSFLKKLLKEARSEKIFMTMGHEKDFKKVKNSGNKWMGGIIEKISSKDESSLNLMEKRLKILTDPKNLKTIQFIADDKIYLKSTAVSIDCDVAILNLNNGKNGNNKLPDAVALFDVGGEEIKEK